jgi:hypothetical protein
MSRSLALVIGCSAVASALAALSVALLVERKKRATTITGPYLPTLEATESEGTETKEAEADAEASAARATTTKTKKSKAESGSGGLEEKSGISESESGSGLLSEEESKESKALDIISCPLGDDGNLWSGVLTVCCVSTLFNFGASTFDAFFAQFAASQVGDKVVR